MLGKAHKRKEEALYKVRQPFLSPFLSLTAWYLPRRGKPASLGSRFMAVAGPDADTSMTHDKENDAF
jgi:hypothetical protein